MDLDDHWPLFGLRITMPRLELRPIWRHPALSMRRIQQPRSADLIGFAATARDSAGI
jgi:hypothetical protein